MALPEKSRKKIGFEMKEPKVQYGKKVKKGKRRLDQFFTVFANKFQFNPICSWKEKQQEPNGDLTSSFSTLLTQ